MKLSEKFKGAVVILTSFGIFAGGTYAIHRAMHSSFFTLKEIIIEGEANDTRKSGPLTPERLIEMAAVPVGKINLFDLDLKGIESRIQSHPWVRSVRLDKKLPGTLRVTLQFRRPCAWIQTQSGEILYLDRDGSPFGPVDLTRVNADLPLLSGVRVEDREAVAKFVLRWNTAQLGKVSKLLSLSYSPDRGFRAIAFYHSKDSNGNRTVVDLGQKIDDWDFKSMKRLGTVVSYLSAKSLGARRILAGYANKIVVKINPSS